MSIGRTGPRRRTRRWTPEKGRMGASKLCLNNTKKGWGMGACEERSASTWPSSRRRRNNWGQLGSRGERGKSSTKGAAGDLWRSKFRIELACRRRVFVLQRPLSFQLCNHMLQVRSGTEGWTSTVVLEIKGHMCGETRKGEEGDGRIRGIPGGPAMLGRVLEDLPLSRGRPSPL